jgi:hypothetical protein
MTPATALRVAPLVGYSDGLHKTRLSRKCFQGPNALAYSADATNDAA